MVDPLSYTHKVRSYLRKAFHINVGKYPQPFPVKIWFEPI